MTVRRLIADGLFPPPDYAHAAGVRLLGYTGQLVEIEAVASSDAGRRSTEGAFRRPSHAGNQRSPAQCRRDERGDMYIGISVLGLILLIVLLVILL